MPSRKGQGTARWKCADCGEVHEGLVEGYGYDAPSTYYTVPEQELASRCQLTPDYCSIDDEDFFVRGCLEIPIIGHTEPFVWGVWVSLSRKNFEREQAMANDPARVDEPPYFGWLSTQIQIYPDTYALKTNVHTRAVGQRPYIELERTDHPLAIEQRNGITIHRVQEIAELMQGGWVHPHWNSQPTAQT